MTKQLRRLMVGVLSLAAVAACDDGTDPVATANVEVRAYVDVDNSNDFDATADDPIQGATVTLAMVGAESNSLTATTDADGLATFTAVEVGAYTASIDLPASMAGVALASASSPNVSVQEDGSAGAEFRYTYVPGAIMGHVFLGSGDYAEGATVVPGVPVRLEQDGTELATTETDEFGAYSFSGQTPGEYTVAVDVPGYLTGGSSSQAVTVTADAEATADFGFDASATHTIAQARAASAGEMVAVVGTAITGNAGEEAALSGSSFYLQDEAGISIYLAGVTASVELGDSVLVYGERGAFNEEVQLSSVAVLMLGEGTVPTPTTVTPTEINAGDHQGELAIVQDLYVDEIGMDGGEPNGNVYMSSLDTSVELVIYVDADAGIDIAATFEVGKVYDVTGVVARYNSLFELKPRMPADVVEETEVGMTVAAVRAATDGTAVTVTGVVTEAGTLKGNGFYMEDATAGIFVYVGFGSIPAGLAIGDVVTVSGERGQYFDVVQITGTVTVEETGATVTPVPTPVTPTELNTGDYQGQLVVFNDVVVSTIDGSTLYVKESAEATDSAVVYLDSDSGVSAGGFAVGETFTIAGVVDNYGGIEQVLPRSEDDVEGTIIVDPLTTIAEARAAESGTLVELTGVVTVTNGPEGMLDYRNAYMQDATGGILIRMPTDSVVELGDSVTVTGTTGAFVAELQVNVDASGIVRHGPGTIPAPRVVTLADLNAGLYQGELAVLEGVEVTIVDGATITVTDGTDTGVIYIDSTTGIDEVATFTVGSSYDVVGVLSRYNDLFELKPRQGSDITAN